MKENVFSREKENGDIEVTCTLTDPPIVVLAPIETMACAKLITELRKRGFYNLVVLPADE